jgi:hypothetical protein
VSVLSVEHGKFLAAKYGGVHSVSTRLFKQRDLDLCVSLREWHSLAYFSGTRAFLALGIDGGDHVTISFSALHCGIFIAVGIHFSHFCKRFDPIWPAINVVTDGVRGFFPIDGNFVRLRSFRRLLASGGM